MKSTTQVTLASEAKQALKGQIPDGERIVWCGQPKIKLFRRNDLIQIPFMVVWTSLAGFMFITSLYHWPVIFPFTFLAGVFLFIGFYMTVGRFGHEQLMLKECLFVLTEQNAHIVTRFPRLKARSVPMPADHIVTVVDKRDGTTDIVFGELASWEIQQRKWLMGLQLVELKPLSFFNLTDAAEALEHLNNRVKLVRVQEPDLVGAYLALSGIRPAASPVGAQHGSPDRPMEQFLRGLGFATKFDFELLPNEKIVWQGKPECAGFRFRRIGILTLPVYLGFAGILYAGLNAILIQTAITIPPVVSYLGIFVLLIAVLSATENALKKNLKYAVTDQRVLALWRKGPAMVKTYWLDLNKIDSIQSTSAYDGVGIIVFNGKNGILEKLFGAEAIGLNPMALEGAEPFFLDVANSDHLARQIKQQRQGVRNSLVSMPLSSRSSLVPFAPREVPAGIGAQILFTTERAKIVLFVVAITSAITIGHFFAYGQAAFSNFPTSLWSAADNPNGCMFLIPLAFSTGAAVFLFKHISASLTQIKLLKIGIACSGTRNSEEKIVFCTNGRPSLCERTYEFLDQNGWPRTTKMYVKADAAKRERVTVLVDPVDPRKAVVLDELPGGFTAVKDGRLVAS